MAAVPRSTPTGACGTFDWPWQRSATTSQHTLVMAASRHFLIVTQVFSPATAYLRSVHTYYDRHKC